MVEVLAKIPLYKMAHATGWPRILPLNLTVSVTYRCNSRCLTCNVYTKDADEFTVDEFDRTFRSLGRAPYWYTMSGGEPFLRLDLTDICESAYRHGNPGIINIPTNGLLSSRIPSMVEEIAGRCPRAQVIINLSLDGIGEELSDITFQSQAMCRLRSPSSAARRRTSTKLAKAQSVKRRARMKPTDKRRPAARRRKDASNTDCAMLQPAPSSRDLAPHVVEFVVV